MTKFRTHALAALVATASLAAPALAGSPYYPPVDAAQADDAAPNPTMQRRMGHFTCSFNERRTRLERKNCGGTRY